jgi:hypothetical protein
MDLAAEAITNGTIKPGEGIPQRIGVKAPQFSFTRLDKADPVTGVEMVSTGEVACFGETFQDAFINALIASNFYVPKKDDAILISMGETRKGILPYARMLARAGYRIFATQHTAEEFSKNGIECKILYKVSEKSGRIRDPHRDQPRTCQGTDQGACSTQCSTTIKGYLRAYRHCCFFPTFDHYSRPRCTISQTHRTDADLYPSTILELG